jgi:hypothetical protein
MVLCQMTKSVRYTESFKVIALLEVVGDVRRESRGRML